MLLVGPSEKELPPAETHWSSWGCAQAFPASGLKLVAAFQIWNLKETQQELFLALGGEVLNPQKCVFMVGGRVAGGCVFTQISSQPWKCCYFALLNWIFFFLLKWYFRTYKVVISIYFKGARFNFVIKLKCLSCIPFSHCTVCFFFFNNPHWMWKN